MSFDYSAILDKVKENQSKAQEKRSDINVGGGLNKLSQDPKDYVIMPEWWEETYGIMGLPFGSFVQISGSPDSGKTSLAITAMKAAQDQGIGIIYVETEQKTTDVDLLAWGVDPDKIIVIKQVISELAWDDTFQAIDSFFEAYPGERLLFIFDSFGNTVSMRDNEIDIVRESQKPGGHAKINNLGVGKIVTRSLKHKIAPLIVNRYYGNVGNTGTTNAGGRVLEYMSKLIIQSGKFNKSTDTVQRKGVQVKKSSTVRWKTTKNHFVKGLKDEKDKALLLPKEIVLNIDSEGIKVV